MSTETTSSTHSANAESLRAVQQWLKQTQADYLDQYHRELCAQDKRAAERIENRMDVIGTLLNKVGREIDALPETEENGFEAR